VPDSAALALGSIDLSDMAFWERPHTERDAAFATLRRERPVAFFSDPVFEGANFEVPEGSGYYAVTSHRGVADASRHPEVFRSGQGAVSIIDLPPEMVEYFSGMISTDDPSTPVCVASCPTPSIRAP
jgi:cytochrome P450